jgi:copper chaperone NosL
MKPISRILLVVAALMLGLMYIFPMWSISLDAPQYPEGLGLKIYINTVKGAEENDLTNINGLNHYIGMKRIEPDSIAELRYMPVIIGVMIVLGLVAAALNRCWMALAWAVMFMVLGIAGLVDFYLWEYDYGHNLDPHAAIVIPGMAYQPPLIGSKQLLNFTAHSYPDIAGYVAGVSILLALTAWWLSCRVHAKAPKTSTNPQTADADRPIMLRAAFGTSSVQATNRATVLLLFAVPMLAACEPTPQAIDFGREECAHCKMTISDKRFAAELLTTKGKAYKFDAIECMAAFVNDGKVAATDIHSLWVMNYDTPGEFLSAKKSFFLQGEQFQSPMSLNLAAFENKAALTKAQQRFGGKELYWDGVRLLVAKEWSEQPSGTKSSAETPSTPHKH